MGGARLQKPRADPNLIALEAAQEGMMWEARFYYASCMRHGLLNRTVDPCLKNPVWYCCVGFDVYGDVILLRVISASIAEFLRGSVRKRFFRGNWDLEL